MNEKSLSEKPSLQVFQDIGYEYKKGSELWDERESISDVVLRDRLKTKLKELNPGLPEEAIQDAVSQLLGFNSPRLLKNNKVFHEKLTDGIQVEYQVDGETRGDFVDVVDFDNPERNDFLVSNQFEIQIGDNTKRIPDILVFLNGLPIGILENKDPTNPEASIQKAYKQVTDTYVEDIPDLFHYNEIIVALDMNDAEMGCLSSGWDWFSPWRYIEEENDSTDELPEFEVLIRGAFGKERLLKLLKYYVLYKDKGDEFQKKLAAYHQFYGVETAVNETEDAVTDPDNNRIGSIWHTQGSGKSLSMVFYANRVRKGDETGNPTLLYLNDRNDLDEQLKDEFTDHGFSVEWADEDDRVELRDRLDRDSGGIIFSTIQMFQVTEEEDENAEEYPLVNDRSDVIVVADEAHRTHYEGLARNLRRGLPNASYLGFTATPIEKQERSTTNAFGGYISQYTIDKSQRDGNTVPIYYQSRLSNLRVKDREIDELFEDLMESKSDDLKEKMKNKWTSLTKIIENNDERTQEIAKDIVEHFNDKEIEGKGMVVAISREAAVNYKRAIEEIPEAPEVEVVISNPGEYIDEPEDRSDLKKRFKDNDSSLKLAVVCDKWLTGFNVKSLHTMYIDKPMKNHNLLQAVGRVNRVYKDKPGGLICDYIGIADNLKAALDKYTTDLQDTAMMDLDKAVEVMKEKHGKVAAYFDNIDYSNWTDLDNLENTRLLNKAQNEVLISDEREKNFKKDMKALRKAHALVTPHNEATEIRSDVVFFNAVLDSIKSIENNANDSDADAKDIDSAMKEIISEGVGIEDLVEVSGFDKWDEEKPVLSDDFLSDVEEVEFENLQIKMLQQLIRNEISTRKQGNLAKYESFEEELEKTINRYNEDILTTEQVIEELKNVAEEIQDIDRRKDDLGLTEEELAFYDAINSKSTNNLSEDKICSIAKDLRRNLKDKVKVDWTSREKIKAEITTEVKRILRYNNIKMSKNDDLVAPIIDQAEAFYGGAAA